MKWFEVWLSNLQPEPFVVRAEDSEKAGEKTLEWAVKKYPGMFERHPHFGTIMLKGNTLMGVREITDWQ